VLSLVASKWPQQVTNRSLESRSYPGQTWAAASEVLGLRPRMFTRTVRQRWTTRWVGESTDCGLQGFETVGYNHPILVSVGSFQTLPNVSFGELA
jgi:hypothetical protein